MVLKNFPPSHLVRSVCFLQSDIHFFVDFRTLSNLTSQAQERLHLLKNSTSQPDLMSIQFVISNTQYLCLLFVPYFLHVASKTSNISYNSALVCAAMVRSSAHWIFLEAVKGVLSLYLRNNPPLVLYSICSPPSVISMASRRM